MINHIGSALLRIVQKLILEHTEGEFPQMTMRQVLAPQ